MAIRMPSLLAGAKCFEISDPSPVNHCIYLQEDATKRKDIGLGPSYTGRFIEFPFRRLILLL